MRKTLNEMALYMKANVIDPIPENFEVRPLYRGVLDEIEARRCVKAYREFLSCFFDYIANHAGELDRPVKNAKNFIQEYPILRNLLYMLYAIGCSIRQTRPEHRYQISGEDLADAVSLTKTGKVSECLTHLYHMGLRCEGIDLSKKSIHVSLLKDIRLVCTDNPKALSGLSMLAKANMLMLNKGESHTDSIDEIFLRCDYHALASERRRKPAFCFEECLNTLQPEYRILLLEVDCFLADHGVKRDGRYINRRFIFTYTNKKNGQVLFTIYISIDGCSIKINADKLDTYQAFVAELPETIKNRLRNAYGCMKALDLNACNPKCKGGFRYTLEHVSYLSCRGINFHFPLDLPQLHGVLKPWLEQELQAQNA